MDLILKRGKGSNPISIADVIYVWPLNCRFIPPPTLSMGKNIPRKWAGNREVPSVFFGEDLEADADMLSHRNISRALHIESLL